MIFEEIPLVAGNADQLVDVTIANTPYTIRVTWNERFKYFSLTIRERGGVDIITNVKMVPYYPLVSQYRLLPFVGDLYFMHRAGLQYRPAFDDIGGTKYGLFYYDPETAIDYPDPLPVAVPASVWDSGTTIWDDGASIWI